MKVVALIRKGSGVDYHRLILPLSNMSWQHGDSLLFIENDTPFTSALFREADIVIYCRICPFPLEVVLKYRDKYKFKLIVDVDDYWYLYDNHHLMNMWLKHRLSEKTIESMKTADFVFCTNDQLKKRILPINDYVEVIKNAFPFGEGQFTKGTEYEGGMVKFIFAGSITHLQDLRVIEAALSACRNDRDITNKIMLKIAGYTNSPTWNRILKVADKIGNVGWIRNAPVETYMNSYNEGHVSIAPLANNEFNTYKSTLKIVEAGCKHIPIICSYMLPYSEDKLCPGVILCRNPKEWFDVMKDLTQNPYKIKVLGEELYQYVYKKYHLNTENFKRYTLFKEISAL